MPDFLWLLIFPYRRDNRRRVNIAIFATDGHDSATASDGGSA